MGYDITDDVAVLQARGATNLETISLGNSAKLKLGQAVTAVGNAGGTGSLVSAAGRVTGLARSITVGDDSGGGARLTGLIETNAALQAGDSGGPLLDASGNVIGMDTAASVDSGFQELASSDGYAIPINKAIAIARRIEGGKASATVHVGGTAFLGVQLDADSFGDSSGALVAGVLPGGPAAAAGLEPGNVITAFDGHAISTPAALSALVLADKPRARVSVTYVDQAGAKHGTTVTLGSGPPQ